MAMWIGRLSINKNRYDFIQSRLTRTSRVEVPRFRFDFKHCKRELGDHVHEALVQAFITEYLEPDGYFFIRLLTVNASDFVVQEIIEKLWTYYVMRYGENDAKKAEESFYAFREQISCASSITPIRSPILDIYDEGGVTDAKRKYMKQYSDMGTSFLRSKSAAEPLLTNKNKIILSNKFVQCKIEIFFLLFPYSFDYRIAFRQNISA
jgi:hypothetical protein